jgi:uncharacterized membrane protein YdjX (TVP38/TMEM64 family)
MRKLGFQAGGFRAPLLEQIKKPGKPLVILIAVFCASAVTLTIVFWPFIEQLRDSEYREQFGAWIKELGVKGVLILLCLQILQIIVAVIPGGPVALIAGAAYGALGGLAICAAGCVIAGLLVLLLVNAFGRPLVLRLFGEKNINGWKFLKDPKRTARVVFTVFLIPGMPKDLLTWLAPLSGLPMPSFLGVSTFARLPAILSTTIMGDSAIKGNWILTAAVFVLTAALGFAALYFRDKLKYGKNEE